MANQTYDNSIRRPQVCLSLNAKTIEELLSEFHNYRDYCTFVEFRVDYLAGYEGMSEVEFVALLKTLKNWMIGKKLIVTCRGYEVVKENVLRWSMGIADFIDVDYLGYHRADIIKEARRKGTKVILSHHENFRMPTKNEIFNLFLKMETFGADVLKIACLAEKEDDMYSILEAAGEYSILKKAKPIIAIAMGEAGQASRICAGDFGSVITYASGTRTTAPGQLNCKELVAYMDRYYK